MRDANLALLSHAEDGRNVHLFAGAGGEVESVAALGIDPDRESLNGVVLRTAVW
jgi:hypothetical protein